LFKIVLDRNHLTSHALEQNEGYHILISLVQGRRSLLIASTLSAVVPGYIILFCYGGQAVEARTHHLAIGLFSAFLERSFESAHTGSALLRAAAELSEDASEANTG